MTCSATPFAYFSQFENFGMTDVDNQVMWFILKSMNSAMLKTGMTRVDKYLCSYGLKP